MLLSLIEVLIVIVPLLLSVAFMTIAERKAMGSMQRRLGPNRVENKTICWKIHKFIVPKRKKWMGQSGIYKITCLLNNKFYYYGSSKDLGTRLKYHYYVTPKDSNKFGLFLKTVGWDYFSVTIVELCDSKDLAERETWYLQKYRPLLNTLFEVGEWPGVKFHSESTKTLISKTLTGKTHSEETKLKMSQSHQGEKNIFFNKSLPKATLDAAALVNSNLVWVYNAETKTLLKESPISNALKLFVKESVLPAHSNKALFLFAPVISLITSLLSWGVVPFGAGLTLSDLSLGILYLLAVSSLGVYGVIFAGWAANSKYAFLGGLRSTAQMVSYEVVLGLIIITVVLLVGSLNVTEIIQAQISVWY
ncbi:hypothetical protein INT47_004837 [Mucor saturninus]|uniref:GIY-YIG domain-containing protein n=1 Tax=Mucor saturninus TaxID=64648 RepID=A0A8H7QQA4_9FUNG|nr:hypothetical protein INT47_004837 [Mucor saturninus]